MRNLKKVINISLIIGFLCLCNSCCSLGIFNGSITGKVYKLPECEHPGDTCYVLLLNELTSSMSYSKFLSSGHPGDTITYAWGNICKGDFNLQLARIDSVYQISDGASGSKKIIGYYPDPMDSTLLGTIEVRSFSTLSNINIIIN